MKDYSITDISLAEWGSKEISIAETEMPGPEDLENQINRS